MTEKQFYIRCDEHNSWSVREKGKNIVVYDLLIHNAQRICDKLNALYEENEQLKKELRIYRRIATCSNCEYQNYDWFEDGDEFEICEKGNNSQQIEYHICKEWEEFE